MGAMKLHVPNRLMFFLKGAILCCLASSVFASCMACPTCTLAAVRHSDKPDHSSLALLALLGPTAKRIWVTANDYNGFLASDGGFAGAPGGANGILGADAKCNWGADANWPGSGAYKAMIVNMANRVACSTANCSTGNIEHADWVLKPNTTYVRSDGLTVIFTADANGVWNFANPLTNSITSTSGWNYQAWTGLNSDWTSAGNSLDCTGWTLISGVGNLGVSTGYNSGYSDVYNIIAYNQNCNLVGRLYCVEQ